MIEGIPKISITIICYKQENLIKRAIESLLVQRDYIYEICVSDDCSPDGTWKVLNQYSKDYPGLFKLHRNDPNRGIFENIEYTWTMPSGDLVYSMAGDDEAGAGWFQKIVEFVIENKIDYKNKNICIYCDYKTIYPNGDAIVHSNKMITTGVNPLKLALRGLICNRGCCWSANITRQFRKVSRGRSHIAEDAQDRQLQIFTKVNYYIPIVGNIYYSYVGVSTQINDKIMKERSEIRPYALSLFESWGIELSEKDKIYSLKCFPAYENMLSKLTVGSIWKWLYYLIKSKDPTIPTAAKKWRSFIFAIRRRLPHKAPIAFQ